MAAPSLPSSAELAKSINHVVIGKWCDMATVAIFFFECMITMDMEVELVWNSKWTFTKVMYLVNRYSTITDIVVLYFHNYGLWVPACQALFHLGIALYIVGIYISESMLVLRVAVVWKAIGKQWIFVVGTLWAMYTAFIIYAFTITFLLLRSIEFFTLLPFGGCLAKTTRTLWLNYTLLLIYDITMFLFLAYPTIKAYRLPYQPTGFVKHVHLEGLFFYIYLCVLDAICLTMQLAVPDDIFIFVMPARIIRAMLAGRVVLHIRDFVAQQTKSVDLLDPGEAEGSAIRFR